LVGDGATDDGTLTNDIINALGIRVAKDGEFTLTTSVLAKMSDVFTSVKKINILRRRFYYYSA
jgi:hypothetical protein